MKNKSKKFILMIIILSIAFCTLSFDTNAEDNVETPVDEKGDLRCPLNDKKSKCKVIETYKNGKAKKVQVTESQDGYTVVKTVSKTKTPGTLKVQFHVSGPDEKITVPKRLFVLIIFDISKSVRGNNSYYNSAVNSVREFSKKIVGRDNGTFDTNKNKTGFIEFATSVFYSRKIKHDDIEYIPTTSEESSHLEKALMLAYDWFGYKDGNKNVVREKYENGERIVVIFGDGRYSSNAHKDGEIYINTCVDGSFGNKVTYYGTKNSMDYNSCSNVISLEKSINQLKDVVSSIYTIRYDGYYNYFKDQEEQWMKNVLPYGEGSYCDATSSSQSVIDCFDNLSKKLQNTTDLISIQLEDRLGSKFKTDEDDLTWTIKKLNAEGKDLPSKSFKIEINSKVEKGWYPTNDGFTLTYGKGKINSTINPEVYWEPEPKDLTACSSNTVVRKKYKDETEYYDSVCDQGKEETDGMSVVVSMKDLKNGTKSFSLNRGEGFSSTISLSNNVKCTYTFDIEHFEKDYSDIKSQYDKSSDKKSDKKEKNRLYGLLTGMETTLKNYIKLVNEGTELKEYEEEFKKQQAVLSIKYKKDKDSKSIDNEEVDYQTSGDVNSSITCEKAEKTKSLTLGKDEFDVPLENSCSINISKKMELPQMCLNMDGAKAEKCGTDPSKEILGKKEFYPDIQSSGGYISIKIPDVDFFGRSVVLEGDDQTNGKSHCEFSLKDKTINNSDYYFRQIELADPFIQTYTDKSRKIGKNWLDSKYDFVKIIKDDTWSNSDNYEYQFFMSKKDVDTIRKDTDEEGLNSYLGKNCYFGKDGKYKCDFIKSNGGKGNYYFTIIYHK